MLSALTSRRVGARCVFHDPLARGDQERRKREEGGAESEEEKILHEIVVARRPVTREALDETRTTNPYVLMLR